MRGRRMKSEYMEWAKTRHIRIGLGGDTNEVEPGLRQLARALDETGTN